MRKSGFEVEVAPINADLLEQLRMRTRDDVRADQLADAFGGFSASLDSGLDAANVAFDDDVTKPPPI